VEGVNSFNAREGRKIGDTCGTTRILPKGPNGAQVWISIQAGWDPHVVESALEVIVLYKGSQCNSSGVKQMRSRNKWWSAKYQMDRGISDEGCFLECVPEVVSKPEDPDARVALFQGGVRSFTKSLDKLFLFLTVVAGSVPSYERQLDSPIVVAGAETASWGNAPWVHWIGPGRIISGCLVSADHKYHIVLV
jgi:hypothetical protein